MTRSTLSVNDGVAEFGAALVDMHCNDISQVRQHSDASFWMMADNLRAA